ncbi:hypothetical protein [Aquabacter spiritensis]|uniref:Uncharacterized protein n=1 Tax=Aquabacter spiritensis TaxID=933073 RepID=A0A4R3LMI6_9HYPH|nr:hypothetical protein [Aquabacter spiritensis]TCT01514.1 hypothetical protein EDC64_11812 [Aquabacter spiritensis]
MSLRVILAAGFCVVATGALADKAAGDKCAANLNTDGKAIYAGAAPQVAPGADLRGIVTAQTQSLVKSGAIGMSGARSAAEAAGKCLAMINS